MADDIVTQLQQLSASLGRGEGRSTVLGAAAEIERLRDELAAWQATVRAHDALAAERADEIERLRSAIDAVLLAITDKGSHPEHHHEVRRRHEREWPTLWRAIAAMQQARS